MNLENFKNLVKLYGGANSYDLCKKEVISTTIHEFNDNKLKSRNNKMVKNKKQAIAIALNQVEYKCTYNSNEKINLIEKVKSNLYNSDKDLNLTNIIETKHAIELLNNQGKLKKIYIFKKKLFDKIINIYIKGNNIDKNIWKEIKKIQEISS